ncbi:MAG: uracil-DNA glycosylase [Spirochaetia bacterium]|nr:uracil-DNA glycosylase [Spirochaetia bacterium]
MDHETQEKRERLHHNLINMWNFYDEVEQYVGDKGESQDIPDFSSYVQSVIKEPKDQFIETIEISNIHQLASLIKSCSRCPLSEKRTHAVPGEGVINAKVMIIGEGPGGSEDVAGIPFVGEAGVYLESWLKAISLNRKENVFITNVVKCRPPLNRDPENSELTTCFPFLEKQIALIKPEAILCLGKVASNHILGKKGTLSSLRGQFYNYHSIPLLVTYHPSAVLRNESLKGAVWQDLQMLAGFLNLPIKRKGSS